MAFDPAHLTITRCEEHINPVTRWPTSFRAIRTTCPRESPRSTGRLVHSRRVRLVSAAVTRYRRPRTVVVQGEQDRDRERRHQGRRKPRCTRPASGLLPTGIYCANETFSINGNKRFNGSITALATEIKINPSADRSRPPGLRRLTDRSSSSPSRTNRLAIGPSRNERRRTSGPGNCPAQQGASVQRLQRHVARHRLQPVHPDFIDQINITGSGAIVTMHDEGQRHRFDFIGNSNFSENILLALVE